MSQHRLDLAWTRTWEDRSHDFSARDGELLVGRVYRMMGGPADRKWRWSMFAIVRNRHGTAGGVVDDRDEACMTVEDAYRWLSQRIG